MKAIDKLFFNTLVKRQGVNMPGIGSFEVVYESAQMVADNIYPPRWRVAYSPQENAEMTSLVKLIETFGKMDSDRAAACYSKWLAEIRIDDKVVFEGVGELKDGKFRQSKEITAALAPEGFKSVRVKRKSHMGIWFGVVLLVVLVALGFYFYNAGYLNQWMSLREDMTDKTELREKQSGEFEQEINEVLPVDSLSAFSADSLKTVESEELSATSADRMLATNATTKEHGRYCLSVGVFTIAENADKTIAKDPLKIGADNYMRIDWRGRVLVYAFSSDDRAEINHLYSQYIGVYSDIAVFDTEQ